MGGQHQRVSVAVAFEEMLSSLPSSHAVVANAIARAGNDSERDKPKGFTEQSSATIRQIKFSEATRASSGMLFS